jgi:tetratricopeptide (TPR) repeat protein
MVVPIALSQEGALDTGLDGVNRARLTRASHLMAAGGHEEARREYQRVLDLRVDAPRALLGMAKALEGLGRWEEAEQTWRRLPTHPEAVEGLATLLLDRQPQEALVLARRLQTLRLGEAPPHLLESRAALAAEDLEAAVASADRYFDWPDRDELPEEGARHLLALTQALEMAGRAQDARRWARNVLEVCQQESVVAEAREAWTRLQAALHKELALAHGHETAQEWGSRGETRLEAQDPAGAEAAWQIAWSLDPAEGRWPAQLGKLLAQVGGRSREAAMAYEVALSLRAATPELAPLSPPPPLQIEPPVEKRPFPWGTGFLVLGAGLGLGLWIRRSMQPVGMDLDALLAKAPHAGLELSGLVAAISHDIIKHNTSVLPALASALEAGSTELPLDVASRVLGRDGADGIWSRWQSLARQIEGLGQRHGVPVRLAVDPVFGPLGQGMADLAAVAPALHRKGGVDPGEIRRISRVINEEAGVALASMLRRLGTCRLDQRLLRACWDAVRSEPGLDVEVGDFMVEGLQEPVWVQALQDDLEVVFQNLLRNALQVSAGASILVRVDAHADAITGLEEVEVHIVDLAPAFLDPAVLASASSKRGLGIARNLLGRHGGALRVEPRNPGKAIVVQLQGAPQ